MMAKGILGAAGLVGMALAPAGAASGRLALHGITLGLPAEQVSGAAGLSCATTQLGDIACHDPADDSTYRATLSGGTPPLVLTVTHLFCSAAGDDAIRRAALAQFGVPPSAVQRDPNGVSFTVGDTGEGLLTADAVACAGGGKHYALSIRGDQLIKSGLRPAEQGKNPALAP